MTKVNSKFGLPRMHKILKADAYASVLRMRVCAQTPLFYLHFCAYKPTSAQTYPRPQLGLIVPKKLSKHAVRRNTIKRLSRECFRLRKERLADGLWAVRLRCNINQLPLTSVQKRDWSIQLSELFDLGHTFSERYQQRP